MLALGKPAPAGALGSGHGAEIPLDQFDVDPGRVVRIVFPERDEDLRGGPGLVSGLAALGDLGEVAVAAQTGRADGQEEQAATDKIKQIPDLRDKRSKLINIIDQYAEILPKEEHVQHEAFVNIIDGYRKDTKIIIQKAEYVKSKDDEKKQKQENFVRHRYKFKLLGTVPDFIEFVNKIENHTRFLKVDAIYIKPVGSADDNTDDIGEKADDQELAIALEQVKEIELTVSTYTYSKGQEKKI